MISNEVHIFHILWEKHHVVLIKFFDLLRLTTFGFYLKAYPILLRYVRPKIEYNTVVWSPYLKKDINLLESVQKRFTRNICVHCNIPFVSYQDHLYKLNIKSLEYRRLVFDLIYVYKIFHNLVEVCFNDFFQLGNNQYNLHRHSWSIKPCNKPSIDRYCNFFLNRICPVWNKLLQQIVSAPNLK